MPLESKLDVKLAQKLILTPQLQQAIRLLQLHKLELAEVLNQEIVENPFLENSEEMDTVSPDVVDNQINRESTESNIPQQIDDSESPLERLLNFTVDEYFEERSSDGRDLGYFNPGLTEHPSFEGFTSKKDNLWDYLIWQLRLSNATKDVKMVAEMVIGNIDENGYLRATDEELLKLTGTDPNTLRKAIELIQTFDPPGVGARDITECLLLQLRFLGFQGSIVESIVRNNLEDLEKKRYSKIAKEYGIKLEDVIEAVKIIKELDPKPGRNYSDAEITYIEPDVFVIRDNDNFRIVLNDDGLPKIRLSNTYRQLLLQKKNLTPEERQFIEEKFRSAIWLIKSLDQRNRTIYRVTETILNSQREFFEKGVEYLKPMTLKDVATAINMHESTISRVTSNKYLACEHGIFCLKFFFSNSIKTESGDISSTRVKELIRKIIEKENPDKPLSDQDIVNLLKGYNINIARRTVSKYRTEMKILSHIQRKTIQQKEEP